MEKQTQISKLLNLKKVEGKCIQIPIYKEPKVEYCTKDMTKDECLIAMSRVSMSVRYQFRKQIQVIKVINSKNRI